MFKSFKFQLLPTKKQKEKPSQHFGCKRLTWDYFLNRRKEENLDNKKTLSYYDCFNELTKVMLKQGLNTSGLETKSLNKQKQVESLSLDKAVKLEAYSL